MVRPDSKFKLAARDYIGVRITNIDDVDAHLYPFDYDLTLAIILAHPDGTVYHRYGGRTDISPMHMDSLIEILTKGVDTHKTYQKNKAAPPSREPLRISQLVNSELKGEMNPVHGCYHCHYVREAIQSLAVKNRSWEPHQFWIWPSTRRLGLVMDQRKQYQVSKILKGSPAATAGLQSGDHLETLSGRRILTKYDIQWILDQRSWDSASIPYTALRGGKRVQGDLALEKGWKVGNPADYAWRVRNVYTQHMNKFLPTPGLMGEPLEKKERRAVGLSEKAFGLKVTQLNLGTFLAGIRLGDIILKAGDRSDFKDSRAFFHWCEEKRQAKHDIKLTLLRRGIEMQVMINKNYLNYQEVTRPPEVMLGFIPQELNDNRGLRVGLVHDESRAERAGLTHGDRIQTVDGETVKTFDDLTDIMADKMPGDLVAFGVRREGKELQVAYVLAEKDQKYTDLATLSDTVKENGQMLTCTIKINIPKGQHIYSVHQKGMGVPSDLQFRGRGYKLVGRIEEPPPRKIDQPGLDPMYVLEGSINLVQKIQVTDVTQFNLLMQIYAQVCDDRHCHEFRTVVSNDGTTQAFAEFRGRFIHQQNMRVPDR